MRAACIGLAALLIAGHFDAAARAAAPVGPGRIRVSGDGKRFVVEGSDRTFVPWGFNYLGRFEHLAEDDWQTPEGWEHIRADFAEMKRLGANVVRWHLQFETFVKAADRVDEQQLARLKRLVELARANGLYLDLTGLNCFRRDRIPAWYDALPEADRWKCQALFWDAVARTCSGDPAVFCYNLMNEPVIGEPGPKDPPWVTGELGGFFFVQRISNKPAGREAKDIAEAWVKTLVAAIRARDRDTLITVGDIAWTVIWPGGKPAFASPEVVRHLDFVSVHLYPATGRIDKDIAALGPYDAGKPLVVEEIFPMGCSVAELDRFIEGSSPRVDGWIAHYFGHTPAEHRAGAKPAGPMVADFLEYWSAKGTGMKK